MEAPPQKLWELSGAIQEHVEVLLIRHALCRFGGNRTAAAAFLGVSARTLRRKIEKYELREADSFGAANALLAED